MAEYKAILSLSFNDTFKLIPHALANTGTILVACTPKGWPGRPYITSRALNDLTVTFTNQVPASGGPYTIDVKCQTP